MDILDQYSTVAPSSQNAIDLFQGEWLSAFPSHRPDLKAGTAPLFNDPRIEWAIEQLGGCQGKTVLELGPLEAGHSYMLERSGAASILAIEANARAYLKCLIAKEVLQLKKVQFLHGDFIEYLRGNPGRFDCCICGGVLYHMKNPPELIALMANVTDQVFIWTHYYDEAVISASSYLPRKFPGSETGEYQGFRHTLYRQDYLEALDSNLFIGGSMPYSYWMTQEDILNCCRYFGFTDISLNFVYPDHPNGPCLALVAKKASYKTSQDRVQKLKQELQQARSNLAHVKQQLGDAEGKIAAMETSKFWKLRRQWFRLKKTIGLPTDE